MEFNDEIFHLAEKMIAGNLTEKEEEEIQTDLEGNPGYKKQFEFYTEMVMASHLSAKEELRQKLAQDFGDMVAQKRKTVPMRRFLMAAMAATILLLAWVGVSYFSTRSSPQELFTQHMEWLPVDNIRGEGLDSITQWGEAMTAYKYKDYKTVVSLLGPVLDDPDFPYKPKAHLFMGLSQLGLNQPEKAARAFQAVSQESSYNQIAQWYEGLAWLNAENKIEAHRVFLAIAQTEGHYKKKEAAEIVEELGKE